MGTYAWWREHNPADSTLVEIRVVRTPLRVELHAVFRYAQVPEPTGEPTNPVGIDKGLTTRLAFCDSRYVAARTVDNTTVRRYQRSLARAKKGSRSRAKKRAALARVQRRETERVRAADFRLAHSTVRVGSELAGRCTVPPCSAERDRIHPHTGPHTAAHTRAHTGGERADGDHWGLLPLPQQFQLFDAVRGPALRELRVAGRGLGRRQHRPPAGKQPRCDAGT